MKQYKILILTDHRGHSANNSVYLLGKTMAQHPEAAFVDVASRGLDANKGFFFDFDQLTLQAHRVDEDFAFEESGGNLVNLTKEANMQDYDFIWLRLPRPIPDGFFDFLVQNFPEKGIINRPSGIVATSNKKFLLRVKELCPPIALCDNLERLEAFRQQFPIVLKPLEEYGGKGILKIVDDTVYDGKETYAYAELVERLKNTDFAYLGMKYLKNVTEGDKRIVVVNGQVVAASLRMPRKGGWLCNVAQGGQAQLSEATPEELDMIAKLSPILIEKGVVMYGMDTLVNDNGKRVLSEVNTLSIGGITPSQRLSGEPLAEQTIQHIFDYFRQQNL